MSYTLPVFPLPVDVYSGPWLAKSLRLSTVGNLAPGRRSLIPNLGWDGGQQVIPLDTILLVPPLTDVRDGYCAGHVADVIECPAGSGRWYSVYGVDDYGKGFANEHRYVLLNKIGSFIGGTAYAGLDWPTPIP